jgi:hypothetical protein
MLAFITQEHQETLQNFRAKQPSSQREVLEKDNEKA